MPKAVSQLFPPPESYDGPVSPSTRGHEDAVLGTVGAWLREQADDLASFYGAVVRRSIDEVLDGPRTGRWDFAQLEKTEKTYVGTKLEIVTRTALKLPRGGSLDLDIEGHPVDVKWSKTSVWQIPIEAVEQLCLCIGGLEEMRRFRVGLVRCREEYLNPGANRDGKRTLSKAGRAAMLILVPPTRIPPNFVAEMDLAARDRVMEEPTIQKRVTRLFREIPRTPIPRDAIRTVAQTEGDPMRRVRADKYAGDPLDGYKILSGKFDNRVVQALGYPRLKADEWMSVPVAEWESVL